jgi:transcriptional regulator GlxA family with amidase domain
MDKTDKMALPSLSEGTSSRRMVRMGPTVRMEVGEVAVVVAVRWGVFQALEELPTTGIVRGVGAAAAAKEASAVLAALRARAEEGASLCSSGIMAPMASLKTVGFLREGRGPLVWEELGDLAERAA